MVQFADLEIARCHLCGKMFQMTSGRQLCRECLGEEGSSSVEVENTLRREENTIERLSRQSGLDPAVVRKTYYGLAEDATPPPMAQCVRCKERPAIEDSEFCLYCHLDLYRALGDASKHLFQRMEVVEHEPGRGMSVISAYRRKRARTVSSRMTLVDTTPRKTF